ncbi:MAG: hypothetical protein RLY31_980 [Bacteroidota bacterium]|jgi:cytochrome c-type biogenesis protein CcmE
MKKIYIAASILLLAAIGMLTNAAGDVSTYSDFMDARETGRVVKIAGKLSLDKAIVYDPAVDADACRFFMRDSRGEEREVILQAAKPQDFERSEQVVVTGNMDGEVFLASEILLKCPSKYNAADSYLKQ